MKDISTIQFHTGSKEELLPGYTPEFPYIASHVVLGGLRRFVPWHWHRAVELFYVREGSLLYQTPNYRKVFGKGSCGLVYSNVLHATALPEGERTCDHVVHIFDPSLIGGMPGGRIEKKYIMPLLAGGRTELAAVPQENVALQEKIRQSFALSEDTYGYEIRLRGLLADIWLDFAVMADGQPQGKAAQQRNDDKIKSMMIYIREHYAETVRVSDLAHAAFISERECYRVFQEYLHTSPAEYLQEYRLQTACGMLERTTEPATSVAAACGLGSSSYFGKVFREKYGVTPQEYRHKWQDCDISGQI